MTPLDRIIGLETQREMLATLTPKQLTVVALRWQGLRSREIADMLGVSDEVVSMRFQYARKAILREFPEFAGWTSGRHFSASRARSQ